MATQRSTDLFWETLREHRQQPYYRALRFKLLKFAAAKWASPGQASAADRPFRNPALRDIWHIRLHQDPEITLFYAKRGSETVFAMLGDHNDYAWRGINARAEPRTANRVNNSVDRPAAQSPHWATLKWQDPLEILNHPDLPELSREASHLLMQELADEASEPVKFERRQGFALVDAKEADFDAYLEDIQRARELVSSLIAKNLPSTHWLDNLEAASGFDIKERVLSR